MRAIAFLSIILPLFSLFTPCASAQERRSDGFELALGLSYHSEPHEEVDISTFGLRYHRYFAERWGFEVSGQVEEDFAVRGEQGLLLDISARLRLFENERIELFTFFGPGVVFYDRNESFAFFDDPPSSLTSDESLTAHAGLGLDIRIAGNAYLRPDLRYRHFADISGSIDDDNFESTIAVGFRF